eukprot:scaffold9468_cov130-Skeletonema_dohrnii-CCMP3373.AAC.15
MKTVKDRGFNGSRETYSTVTFSPQKGPNFKISPARSSRAVWLCANEAKWSERGAKTCTSCTLNAEAAPTKASSLSTRYRALVPTPKRTPTPLTLTFTSSNGQAQRQWQHFRV